MTFQTIRAAKATRQGVREYNADSAALHTAPGTDITAGAIVDGIGSSPEVAHLAHLAAETAARIGARRTAMIGILAAAELATVPAGVDECPDGVAVLAVARPRRSTSIAWTGDARAYGFDGKRLVQRTTDQTMGQWLRYSGGTDAEIAGDFDTLVLSSLSLCSIATVRSARITDPVVILTSDGIHDSVDHDHLEALARAHHTDPQALADALVNAARADDTGYRDDATAIVLTIP
ncbi:hypothetical protein ABZ990_09910 [Streptomyces sp. NPDC046203]|uniref:PP2C family protein-serine/threonine phosphatase n=1 Tax=Streptomyces sp. NPDC046203 TaxID=3154602 RepID=UPI0033CCDAD0